MPLKTKRWCSPIDQDDGFRVLITRYRPRGLPKKDETWDVWMRELGPSPELFRAFKGKGQPPISVAEYRARYLAELEQKPELISQLAGRLDRGETVTLLCSRDCIIAAACHRTFLAERIQSARRVPEGPRAG